VAVKRLARYVNLVAIVSPSIFHKKYLEAVMARKYKPKLKLCDCGCGRYPRGADYMPGHDVRIYSAIVGHVGSLRNLREVVERYTGKRVNINHD